MKNIIIVVLLILLPVVYFQHDRIDRMIGPTGTIQSGSVEFKDLAKIDDLYYKKFTGAPFTGKVTGQEQGYLEKGNWDGSWITYYKDGRLKSKGICKNGVKVK